MPADEQDAQMEDPVEEEEEDVEDEDDDDLEVR